MRVAALLALALLAGCASPLGAKPTATDPAVAIAQVAWGAPKVIDPVRSGGEPVLFVTPKGTLLMAVHPGFTHVKAPPGPEVVQETNGQSYLFRSADGGATWSVVTGANGLPRNNAPGDSDPDVASTADGSRLVVAQLDGVGISSEASKDDAATFPAANPFVAMPQDGSVDRPWVAQWNGTFYLLYNGDGNGHWRFLDSKDGTAWSPLSTPGDGSYPGAIAVGPEGALYVGNGDKVWASVDGGKTFDSSKIPGVKPLTGITAQRPAVDDAGNVYFAWSELHGIYYAASRDHGKTWGPRIPLWEGGDAIWPWPVAGADGRLAVAWVGTTETNDDASAVKADWLVHVAYVEDAANMTPRVSAGPIAGAVVTKGGICLDGTICEAEGKDRRLGDFITIAADRTGTLMVAYGTTTTGHSISSPAFVKQSGGPKLR